MTGIAEPQHLTALAEANRVRLARAQLKREVSAGRRRLDLVVANPPEYAVNMPLSELLLALPRVGHSRMGRFHRLVEIGQQRTLGQLSDRQRALVIAELGIQFGRSWRAHVRAVAEVRP